MSARSVVDVRLSIANYLEIDRVHFRKNDSCTTFMSIVNLSMFSFCFLDRRSVRRKVLQRYNLYLNLANFQRFFFVFLFRSVNRNDSRLVFISEPYRCEACFSKASAKVDISHIPSKFARLF